VTVNDAYPFSSTDVESVPSANIREGDLLAFRGEPGTGRWSGNPVTHHGRDGYSTYSKCTVWRIEYRTPSGRDSYLLQPDNMPVTRIRTGN
jgi:hypothetical protein